MEVVAVVEVDELLVVVEVTERVSTVLDVVEVVVVEVVVVVWGPKLYCDADVSEEDGVESEAVCVSALVVGGVYTVLYVVAVEMDWSDDLTAAAVYGTTIVVMTSTMAKTLVPMTTKVGAMSFISSLS